MVGCHYFPPGLRLPSQPQSITAPWPVPSYTAWWQRHIDVKLWTTCPKVITQLLPRVGYLLIASLTLYPFRHRATYIHVLYVNVFRKRNHFVFLSKNVLILDNWTCDGCSLLVASNTDVCCIRLSSGAVLSEDVANLFNFKHVVIKQAITRQSWSTIGAGSSVAHDDVFVPADFAIFALTLVVVVALRAKRQLFVTPAILVMQSFVLNLIFTNTVSMKIS